MSSLSALSTVHMYFSLYGFLFSFRFHNERFETMRFDLRQKVSSFVVVKKKKTQSINGDSLELTTFVPTEHFLR